MRSIAVISTVVCLYSTQTLALDSELEGVFDDVIKHEDSFARLSQAGRNLGANSAVRSAVFHTLTPQERTSYLISMTKDQRVRFIEAALRESVSPEEARNRMRTSYIMPDIIEGNSRFRKDLIDMIGVMHMELDSKILAKRWKAEIKLNSAPGYSSLMDKIDRFFEKNPPVKPPLSPKQLAALSASSFNTPSVPKAPDAPTLLASTSTKLKTIDPFEDDDEGIIIFDDTVTSSSAP